MQQTDPGEQVILAYLDQGYSIPVLKARLKDLVIYDIEGSR